MLLHQPPYYPLPNWRSDGLEFERAEEMRRMASKGSPGGSQHYGESVKRHLDSFELETSLNEVSGSFVPLLTSLSISDRRRKRTGT